MNKAQAIQHFWESFGIPAYDETIVPDDAVMPYITYSVSTSSVGSLVILSGSVWYHSTSWKDVTDKAEQIAEELGYGGKIIPLDSGYLYLYHGDPFGRRMSDPDDQQVRRIIINISAEFLTEY